MAMFGDYYDGEWFIWLAIYGLVYSTFEQTERERLIEEQEAMEREIEDQDAPPIEGDWDSPMDAEVEFQTRR
jgi:hypothetical protein